MSKFIEHFVKCSSVRSAFLGIHLGSNKRFRWVSVFCHVTSSKKLSATKNSGKHLLSCIKLCSMFWAVQHLKSFFGTREKNKIQQPLAHNTRPTIVKRRQVKMQGSFFSTKNAHSVREGRVWASGAFFCNFALGFEKVSRPIAAACFLLARVSSRQTEPKHTPKQQPKTTERTRGRRLLKIHLNVGETESETTLGNELEQEIGYLTCGMKMLAGTS